MEENNKISPLSEIKPSKRLNRRLSNKKRDSFADEFSLFYDDETGKKKQKVSKRSSSGVVDQYI